MRKGLALLCVTALVLAGSVSSRPMDTQTTLNRPLYETVTAEYALVSPLDAFERFITLYNKGYTNDPKEKKLRFEIFRENANMIAQHNADPSSTFKMAVNAFTDMTFDEFSKVRLGLNAALKETKSDNMERKKALSSSFKYANVTNIPNSIDWRERNAVTEVKDQAMCGSCWAFSTTGAIEGINAIKTGKLVSLSEQQLVSCDTEKNMGCGGGLMDYAFEYVIKNGGIDTEKDYGYWSWGIPCQRRREQDRPAVTIDSYEDLPPNDPQALKKALAHQPVSVAICASPALQFYSSGIVKDDKCCENLNHGVLAVGYSDDEESEDGHWIVKNSWGGGWGESGYFRLTQSSQHPEGACGIHKMASYPIKNDNTNPEIPEVCGLLGWQECPLHQKCVCNFSFFGLFCFPFTWGCEESSAPMSR